MRSSTCKALLGAGAVLGAGGCDAPSPAYTQNCPIEAHSPSNTYQLSYRLVSPEPCPATLSDRGQLKEAAARIVDGGEIDMFFASAEVKNRLGELMKYDIEQFERDLATREWAAVPRVTYRAGTALPPPQYTVTPEEIEREYDLGRFETWRSAPEQPGNPYGVVRITYRASGMVANVIAGTRIPHGNTTATWYASATGGVTPYRYQWYRDRAPVGNGSSYTAAVGETDFELRVEITDVGGNVRAAAALIDVDGVLSTIVGPETVYASQGGGAWTVEPDGGYAPYTVDWYRGDARGGAEEWIGSGLTWEGYPGEGSRRLRAHVTDARGVTHNATLRVMGFGSGDGTCDPAPGQVDCVADG